MQDQWIASALKITEEGLTELNFENAGITDDLLDQIIAFLNACPIVTALSFASNPNLSPSVLVPATPNQITTEGLRKLSSLKYIITADFSGLPIGDDGAIALAENSQFQCLNVYRCGIGPRGYFAFLENSALLKLNIENEKLPEESWEDVPDADFRKMVALANFNFSQTDLNDALNNNVIFAIKILWQVFNSLHEQAFVDSYQLKWKNDPNNINKDLKRILGSMVFLSWETLLEQKLNDNLARIDPAYARILAEKRNNQKLHLLVRNAIIRGDLAQLSRLIPQLSHGVNTELEEFGSLINCSLLFRQPQVTVFLLAHGAKPDDQFPKTSPLLAAIFKNDLDSAIAFLRHRSSLLGNVLTDVMSFDKAFNVVAFQMCDALVSLLNTLPHCKDSLPSPLRDGVTDFVRRWKSVFPPSNYKEILFNTEIGPWDLFGRDDLLLYGFASLALQYVHNLSKDNSLRHNEFLKKATTNAKLYRLLHDMFAITTRREPLNIASYFETLSDAKCIRLLPLLKPLASTSPPDRASLEAIVKQFNLALTDNEAMAVDGENLSPMFTAKYGCLHYDTHTFDSNSREEHSRTHHLGITAPVSAIGQPHYMSSEFMDDALLYGFGVQDNNRLRQDLLKPKYQRNGHPTNIALGKIFVSLLSLADASSYIFYEDCLKVPDLSLSWNQKLLDEFGLGREKFHYFKRKFPQLSNDSQLEEIGDEIIKHVIAYKRHQLLWIVKDEAELRGGILLYKQSDNSYALDPEAARVAKPAPVISNRLGSYSFILLASKISATKRDARAAELDKKVAKCHAADSTMATKAAAAAVTGSPLADHSPKTSEIRPIR